MLAATNLSTILREKLVEYESLSDKEAQYKCLNQITDIVLTRLNELTANDLMIGSNKIPSLLWVISAAAALLNKPNAFLAVWERFGQHITLEALLSVPQEGPYKGKSALWWLCLGVEKQGIRAIQAREVFLKVWDRFKQKIELETLLVVPPEVGQQEEKYKLPRKSALELLCNSEMHHWWKTLFQQNKGIISGDQIAKLDFQFRLYTPISLKQLAEPIVPARNQFFIKLSKNFLLNPNAIQTLFKQARIATDAGYVNAFYDLSHFLTEHNLHEEAFEAQKQIPNTSWYYAQTLVELCEHSFNRALVNLDKPASRMQYLREALQFALISDDDNKPRLIQRVANIYIENNMNVADVNLVPNEWLEAMNGNTPVDWCFNRFLELDKNRKLEQKLKENEKSLEEERKVKKHLLARMEMLENENQMLKKTKTEAALENQNPNTETGEEKKTTLFFSTQRIM